MFLLFFSSYDKTPLKIPPPAVPAIIPSEFTMQQNQIHREQIQWANGPANGPQVGHSVASLFEVSTR